MEAILNDRILRLIEEARLTEDATEDRRVQRGSGPNPE
jgi:hypothetical protein